MRILAIDTTAMTASVAVCEDKKTIAEFTLDFKQTHSQTIMPLIDNIFKMLEAEKDSIDYIACACGPGSFTGLRIGAATAKGLALGLNKKIIPVPSLDSLAYNIFNEQRYIVPIMDARRNQVFGCVYSFNNKTGYEKITDYLAEDIDCVLDFLKQNDMPAVFLGDGSVLHREKIANYGGDFVFAPVNMNMARAASVGAYALNNIESAITGEEFNIMYLRKSQAEREYDERERSNG